jgi:hypothetical protein
MGERIALGWFWGCPHLQPVLQLLADIYLGEDNPAEAPSTDTSKPPVCDPLLDDDDDDSDTANQDDGDDGEEVAVETDDGEEDEGEEVDEGEDADEGEQESALKAAAGGDGSKSRKWRTPDTKSAGKVEPRNWV